MGIGCLYAKQNGFTNGASDRHGHLPDRHHDRSAYVTGIATSISWVSYTVSENIWTTFSAVLGKTRMTR